jgi:hypothetical protein
MRIALVFIALSLLLTACSRRARIVGTWHDQSGTFAMVFNSDGSFTSGEEPNHNAGTWQLSGKILTMTLTNSTGPHPDRDIGETVHCRIIHIDSHVLSYKVGGQTTSLSR